MKKKQNYDEDAFILAIVVALVAGLVVGHAMPEQGYQKPDRFDDYHNLRENNHQILESICADRDMEFAFCEPVHSCFGGEEQLTSIRCDKTMVNPVNNETTKIWLTIPVRPKE